MSDSPHKTVEQNDISTRPTSTDLVFWIILSHTTSFYWVFNEGYIHLIPPSNYKRDPNIWIPFVYSDAGQNSSLHLSYLATQSCHVGVGTYQYDYIVPNNYGGMVFEIIGVVEGKPEVARIKEGRVW